MTDQTEYINPKQPVLMSNSSWMPTIGQETEELIDYFQNIKGLDQESSLKLKEEAIRILARCGNPNGPACTDTGLVYGYVQSGKTMSYTTLAALAKDNNYQAVIVIAGTITNLLEQTTGRLKTDLRLMTRTDRAWKFFENPELKDFQSIRGEIDVWRDGHFPEHRKTILITVLKKKERLEKLVKLVRMLNLRDSPILVIDDEGDQASLNTKARRNARFGEKEASAIYAQITELKKGLPHHTYLQYTATPQAPLFINQLDRLSPNFIELLTPGKEYVGVKEFFDDHAELIKDIPADEIYDKENQSAEPPESLLEALRLFFLEVMLGDRSYIAVKNLSMMVHPSHKTTKHNIYYRWVTSIRNRWMRILNLGTPDEKKILMEEFRKSYAHIKSQAPDIPDFNEWRSDFLAQALKTTDIHELNSKTKVNTVQWYNNYANILVGGQVMDRGFTVEGLVITYMPRGVGVGNADTIQQRGRFFGYKKRYLRYCRIFLGQETRDAYEKYVIHEEDMRTRLAAFRETSQHLDEWERKVKLEMYKLTRSNVLSGKQKRYHFPAHWTDMKAPHDSGDIIIHNREVVRNFVKNHKFHEDKDVRNKSFHEVAEVPLQNVFEELLDRMRFTRESDSNNFTMARAFIRDHIDKKSGANAVVYLMSKDESRVRNLSKKNEIDQIFQGPSPTYPGDTKIKDKDRITVQIHRLDLQEKKKTRFKDVYAVAVWLPESVGADLVGVDEEV